MNKIINGKTFREKWVTESNKILFGQEETSDLVT